MSHAINWFEIPVVDYDRAVEFYSTVLDREITEFENETEPDMAGRYGLFRTEEGEIGGALAQMDGDTAPKTPTGRFTTLRRTTAARFST